jgi:hypothetical protein
MTLTKVVRAGRSKEAKAKKILSNREFFFYQNAGYSFDPSKETAEQGRIRCAKSYAADEKQASEFGFIFEWNQDEIGCDCAEIENGIEEPHDVLCCLVYDAEGKTVLASLSGICEPSTTYRKVVEAELAGEAIEQFVKQVKNASN